MADISPPTNGTSALVAEETLTVSQALTVYAEMLRRLVMSRAGITFSGRRDLYETLGYRRILRYADYKERYQRGGIAARIIDAFPAATWRTVPTIQEVGKEDETMPSLFESTWTTLAARLQVWATLMRADRLASLGHYAIIVLGLRNQVQWETPAQRVRSADDVLYLQAFAEEHALILSLVSESSSPLFGRPATYSVDFSRRASMDLQYDDILRPILGQQYGTRQIVHASRLLHITENGLEDTIVGTPRLRAVWNYLDDLEKVIGGSGEMFWQDAKRRLVLSLDPTAEMSPVQGAALSEEVEEFVHEMRNFLRVQGMQVTQLAGHIPDPRGNADALLDLIAGTVHLPRRILIGNEAGKLASEQDENNWALQTSGRQLHHAEPILLRPLIDWLIAVGALPVPQQGYVIEWPGGLALSELERAQIALAWAQTLAAYAGTGATPQDILPLEIFLVDIMEFSQEQVQRIMGLLAGDAVATGVTTP